MVLHVIGTGSSGNCYVLENREEALVIETGVPFLDVKRKLGFNILKIVGVIQTHSHKDHCKYEKEYEAAGIKVYKPYEMENPQQKTWFGNFLVSSFPAVHNVPCVGYLIGHPDIGKILYATDTEYVKYRFNLLTAMLIEANYSKDLIPADAPNRNHVMTGHMELETTLGCIEANKNPALRDVILCHLSDRNSDEEMFRNRVQEVVGGGCRVAVASAGMTIDLADIPFLEDLFNE